MADDPKFPAGTCVTERTIVADMEGRLWWINPGHHLALLVRFGQEEVSDNGQRTETSRAHQA